jgi:hypothetical protein
MVVKRNNSVKAEKEWAERGARGPQAFRLEHRII